MFTREAAILRDFCGDYVLSLLHGDAFVAGGALTSVFSGSKINDLDVFFFDEDVLAQALAAAPRDEKTVETESALSIISNGHRVQLIKAVTGGPRQVISGFDFTICQAAWDYHNFYLGDEFLHHLAQRRLVFNVDAGYPICSLYRLRKFIRRGFHFSGIEAIKLGLRIQALKIETVGELRRQLMGIDTLFLKDLTDRIAGDAEKAYDFNDFMDLLGVWLDKLDVLTGQEEE